MQDHSHDLSDILDGSVSERTKRAGKIAGRVRKDYATFKQETEVLGAVLEKTPTLQHQRDRRILAGLSDDYRAFQGQKPTGLVPTRDEKVTEQQKVEEPMIVVVVESSSQVEHPKIQEPVIKELNKTTKKTPNKAVGPLLDQSLSGPKKFEEPVDVKKVESEVKKSKSSLKKSLSDEEQISEQSSIDDESKALLHKEEPSRGYLYILGNILLGVVSLGIIHAIFYIGSLIVFGAQLQKWESKDPVTWFFHRVNAKVVFKTEDDVIDEDLGADKISCGV